MFIDPNCRGLSPAELFNKIQEGSNMTTNLIGLMALVPLAFLLLLITRQDVRYHKIPNKLVMIGIVLGMISNELLPAGQGFNSAIPGGLGWLDALKGLGFGMAIFFPIYWLNAMGAGDVKLMGMVGAFLGPTDVLGATFAIFITGGLMALALVLWSKQFYQTLQNIKVVLMEGLFKIINGQLPLLDDLSVSVGKLPYAVAISVGTLSYLVWQRVNLIH